MLGLKLNHVSKRGHWCLTRMYFQVEDQIDIPHCCIKCCHTICCFNQVEAGPIFFRHWIQYLFSGQVSLSSRIYTFSGFFWTCQMSKLTAEVDPIAHFCLFRSNPATCMWLQINSKIFTISICHSSVALILEFTSILVWIIYQIIHLQRACFNNAKQFSAAKTLLAPRLMGAAILDLGYESGMPIWLCHHAKMSWEYLLILWYLIHKPPPPKKKKKKKKFGHLWKKSDGWCTQTCLENIGPAPTCQCMSLCTSTV